MRRKEKVPEMYYVLYSHEQGITSERTVKSAATRFANAYPDQNQKVRPYLGLSTFIVTRSSQQALERLPAKFRRFIRGPVTKNEINHKLPVITLPLQLSGRKNS